MYFIRKVVRVGNSLHMSLPETICSEENINKGDLLYIEYRGKEVVIDLVKTADLNNKTRKKERIKSYGQA